MRYPVRDHYYVLRHEHDTWLYTARIILKTHFAPQCVRYKTFSVHINEL